VVASCKQGNEYFGSIKVGELFCEAERLVVPEEDHGIIRLFLTES
jgi:hypothetical protein